MSYAPTIALFSDALNRIEMSSQPGDDSLIMTTGFRSLDSAIGGYKKGEMVVVAARTGMGKTGFLLSGALHMTVDHDIPVGYVTLESNATDIALRMISIRTGIPMKPLLGGKLGKAETVRVQRESSLVGQSPFLVRDFNTIRPDAWEEDLRGMISENGLQALIVDQVQMLGDHSVSVSRFEVVTRIAEKLKRLAQETGLVLIAASQLSRSVDLRGGSRRPVLSDLRDSGALEDNADKVIFIYRPEYYGIDCDEDGNSTAGIAYITVAKNRSGQVVELPFRITLRTGKFFDVSDPDEPGFLSMNDFTGDNVF